MSRHAGPSSASNDPAPPEPSYAERARTLAHVAHTGALATLARRHRGHPFASVMPYATDAEGAPIVLISSMAMHTQNLEADPRASLLVTQPDAADPLASGRVTLMAEARRLDRADRDAARAIYLARHANASYWVDFEDFAFWRLEVRDIYFVGGFAAMDWVTADAYRTARPDPLADVAAEIMEHMNRDHADALLTYARAYAGEPADEARMVGVDRLGFKLRLVAGERRSSARIAFPREVATAEDTRRVLIEMLQRVRDARTRSGP
jgi:putative heme iron utilization protein